MTATNASPPAAGQFTIGATSTDTATNLQAALTQSLGTLANTQLVAASAVQAGNDFFNTDASHPPQRVDGPPFDTATAMVDGTAANTVAWYTGDNATDDPRSTALARADQSLVVSYGARANEQGLRVAVQSLAVFAATQFSVSDPNGEAQYSALKQRVGTALVGGPNQQAVSDIEGPTRRRPGRAQQCQGPPRPDQHDAAEPAAERRGRADRAGRGAAPVAADEPAGHAADHGDAAEDAPSCSISERSLLPRNAKAPRRAAGLLYLVDRRSGIRRVRAGPPRSRD